MLVRILLALSVVFGLIVANPVEETSSSSNDVQIYDSDGSLNYELLKTDTSAIILDAITSLIGYKESALTIAVVIIKWIVSNCPIIAFGALTTLGFCKLTGKCSLLYSPFDDFMPVAQLRSFVTNEYLETAEKFLVTAVEKYAQERSGGR